MISPGYNHELTLARTAMLDYFCKIYHSHVKLAFAKGRFFQGSFEIISEGGVDL